MNPTLLLRSTMMRGVGAATVALAGALLAGLLLGLPGASDLLTWSGPVGLLAVTGAAAFWRPYVEVSDGAVLLRNPFRTLTLPWPAVHEVDGRYGLRISTPWGRYSAWAAAAPSGRERLARQESEAAVAVRQRLDLLREAGHLDHSQVEFEEPPVTWHRGTLTLTGALVVLSMAGPLVARIMS